MQPEVVMVMGYPASGKSSLVAGYAAQGYRVLSRDRAFLEGAGGKVADLLPEFTASLARGEKVILDNTFGTVEGRAPFLRAAAAAGAPVRGLVMGTTLEEAQVNALNRMWDRYGRVFLAADEMKGHKDPGLFPLATLFAFRKRWDGDKKKGVPPGKPTKAEGFASLEAVPFVRRPWPGKRRALLLDVDGTLRDDARNHGGAHPYPVHPDQVSILPNRRETLAKYKADGWLLLGVSTQSGVEKGHLTLEMARRCFDVTMQGVGAEIDIRFCPHHSFPVACYCRKPQAGLGVALIREYDLDPSASIMVGDMSTDRTFAERCGFQFAEATDFFHAPALTI